MSPMLRADALRAFSESLCRAAGLSAEDAALLSDSILFAEVRRVASHGLLRLPQYIARIRAGITAVGAEPEVVTESGAIALIDAKNGLGQIAGLRAVEKAEELARLYGISFVGVKNSSHFGTGAWFARPSAERGFFAFNLSSAPSAMAPYGARDELLGTDPVCLALPRGEGKPPLILDMALSTAARGKVRLAALNGEPIPADWGLDRDGAPTTDPNAVLEGGSLLPIGGAKGSGLAIFTELLCSVLTGSGILGGGGQLSDLSRTSGTGHIFGCVEISRFLPADKFTELCEESLARITALSPAKADGEVLLPGEPEERNTAACLETGIPVSDALRAQLNKLAEELGCSERI